MVGFWDIRDDVMEHAFQKLKLEPLITAEHFLASLPEDIFDIKRFLLLANPQCT